MNLLVDENVHRLIAGRLADQGHVVVLVADLAPSIADDAVLAMAVAAESVLITNDLDFGELVYRGGATHAGVLLLRLGEMSYADQADLVARVVAANDSSLVGAFSVLTQSRLRTRS